jgi:hypothetical protein
LISFEIFPPVKDTGVRRVLVAGICPEVPESSHNFQIIFDKCQVDLTPSKVTGDLKGLNILWGVGPCSSAYPVSTVPPEGHLNGNEFISTKDVYIFEG